MTPGEARRVLGVAHDAGDEDVRSAFRAIAQRVHPDVNPDPDAAQRFDRARKAAQTLLHDAGGAGPGPSSGPASGAGGHHRDARAGGAGPDLGWDPAEDILDAMFGTEFGTERG